MSEDLQEFSEEDLKQYNGQDGKPVYIAYDGNVYDVSTSKMWRTGMHMNRHPSGMNLTDRLYGAPHGSDVFDRFPRVGTLKGGEKIAEVESNLPRILEVLLQRVPFLKRHPHPMTVHFPVAFFVTTPLFVLLFLITRQKPFELTSVNTLGAGLLFSLAAIPTGFLTWWINYLARPVKAVTIKIVISIVMVAVGSVAFVWRLMDPQVLYHIQGVNIIYLVLILLLAPLVGVVATYGATLTFPIEKKKE